MEVTYLTFDGNDGRSRSREDGRQGAGGTAPMCDSTCQDHRYLIRSGSLRISSRLNHTIRCSIRLDSRF